MRQGRDRAARSLGAPPWRPEAPGRFVHHAPSSPARAGAARAAADAARPYCRDDARARPRRGLLPGLRQARRPGRDHHRRRQRHRPRGRHRLRPRGRGRPARLPARGGGRRARHRPLGRAGRPPRRAAPGRHRRPAALPGHRRARRGRVRPARRPGQQRRLPTHLREDRGHRRRGVGPHLPHQHPRHVLPEPGGRAAHEPGRLDREHDLDPGQGPLAPAPGLRRHQGRDLELHGRARADAGRPRHPGERGGAGPGLDAADPVDHAGREGGELRAADPAGAGGAAAGAGAGVRAAGVGRRELHDRGGRAGHRRPADAVAGRARDRPRPGVPPRTAGTVGAGASRTATRAGPRAPRRGARAAPGLAPVTEYRFVALVLALIGPVLALGRLAPVPDTLVLFGAGLASALVPGLPPPHLDPRLALELFLPPLLYAGASRASFHLLRFSLLSGVLLGAALSLATVAAVALGPAVAWLRERVRPAPVEIAVSLATPYAGSLASTALGVSVVVTIVTAALVIAAVRIDPGTGEQRTSAEARVSAVAFWEEVNLVLSAVLFVMAGRALPEAMAALHAWPLGRLVGAAAALLALVLLVQFGFSLAAAALPHPAEELGTREEAPRAAVAGVMAWASTRSVIGLVIALSVPAALPGGGPFAARDLVLAVSALMIVGSVLLQGLTLGAAVRRAGLAERGEVEAERRAAREAVGRARGEAEGGGHDAARRTALELRAENRIGDEVAREMLRETDLHQRATEESPLPGAGPPNP